MLQSTRQQQSGWMATAHAAHCQMSQRCLQVPVLRQSCTESSAWGRNHCWQGHALIRGDPDKNGIKYPISPAQNVVGCSGAYGAVMPWGEEDGEILPQTAPQGQPGCLPSMGCSTSCTPEVSPSTGYRS